MTPRQRRHLKDAGLAGRCSASRPILQDNLDLGVSGSYPRVSISKEPINVTNYLVLV